MYFSTSIRFCVAYCFLASLLSAYCAEELPSPFVAENQTIPSVITNYAALGDSYAAGIAAGKQIHRSCWRFRDSYPMQLIRTGVLGQNHSFQFLACSGAVMGIPGTSFNKQRAIARQIKALKPTDLVTLSIGGNDAGFFDILNACIYRFYGIRSGNCIEQLSKSLKLIDSDEFAQTYDKVLAELLAKGAGPHFRILALGYSPFFDDALTDECNNMSFGYWKMWRPKLTVRLRRQLNDVSLHLNKRIVEIINERGDDRIVWVDWAPQFKNHLFCQPGKSTPTDGDNTWFFDVDFRSANLTRDDALDPGFDPDMDLDKCAQQSLDSGDWGYRAACGIAMVQHKQDLEYPHDGNDSGDDDDKNGLSINRYPNQPGLARVFHPKPQGYKAVAEVIQSYCPHASSEPRLEDENDVD
ncbi:uncharacterized protein PADG_02971 [Paracoccidioides brasiliensis Pb18]|uniref:SGNH hydrolase-type esterase domain-containing protein n=1 Tax=Paracoccidioides brasiliensis (strain Pb18) TaxID=502780 RepID=C1G716_PARBD|nr:uncharacterized protein PADG_02971 [Paracoccidioides brasiliensis Pb18]EEH46873.2 hypothetical protein PADG_02971 [Paracoccidioides brasiliensis Pb18]ODH48848.1 hypothetical protein GX48_05072 [Paracoccidioides brasiliensis]